jgi:hypothetical protein
LAWLDWLVLLDWLDWLVSFTPSALFTRLELSTPMALSTLAGFILAVAPVAFIHYDGFVDTRLMPFTLMLSSTPTVQLSLTLL